MSEKTKTVEAVEKMRRESLGSDEPTEDRIARIVADTRDGNLPMTSYDWLWVLDRIRGAPVPPSTETEREVEVEDPCAALDRAVEKVVKIQVGSSASFDKTGTHAYRAIRDLSELLLQDLDEARNALRTPEPARSEEPTGCDVRWWRLCEGEETHHECCLLDDHGGAHVDESGVEFDLNVIREAWTPTSENINALPGPIRRYITDIETLCDPAGLVRENAIARDTIAALTRALSERGPEPEKQDA